jgi:carboxymethylenebutenolidase
VAPKGRAVLLPVVVVMGFEADKIAYERIYWDQASLLVQVGPIDDTLLPVTGVTQAHKVMDKDLPANTLLGPDQSGASA